MLEALGAFGLDADALSQRAMSPGAPAYDPVVKSFGQWIVAEDGKINRDILGQIAFSNPEAMGRLEGIVHPIVRQAVDLLVRRSKQEVVAIEAIKLIETGLGDLCDAVWVIDSPEDVRLKRLMDDRKLSESDAQLRINSQNPQADKIKRADTVIDNTKGYEDAFEQVQVAYQALMEPPAPPKVEEAPAEPTATVSPPAPAADIPSPGERPMAPPAGRPASQRVQTGTLSGKLAQPTAAPTPAPGGAITVQRAGPGEAEKIAAFLNKLNGTSLTRSEVLMQFGQKAYMLVMQGETLIALGGFQVENLITRVDEFLLGDGAPVEEVVPELVKSIEEASSLLQSEIALIFIPEGAAEDMRRKLIALDYEPQKIEELRVPDWRDAAEESQPEQTMMLVKRLREDRVLKPI